MKIEIKEDMKMSNIRRLVIQILKKSSSDLYLYLIPFTITFLIIIYWSLFDYEFACI